MADFNIDDELAALEEEVENEKKTENKNQGGSQNNFGNNNKNFGNNNMNFGNNNMNFGNSNNTQYQSKKINYNEYGDNSDGLMDFLSGIDFSGNNNNNNNNQQNNNFNFNNQNNNYNNYTQYGNNNNNNFNDYYNNRNTNYNNNYNNNRTNYNNNNNNNNNYNKNYNNNNYNNYNNNNNNNYNNNYNKNYNNNNNNNNNNNRNMNSNYQKNNMNSNKQNQYSNPSQSKQNTQSNNQSRAQNQKPQQSQQQYQQKQQQSQTSQQQKQIQSKVSQSKNDEPSEDIYPEKQEGMYHKIKEMKSLTVLEEEIALCDKIITFKKKKGLDYDEWETKKELAEMQLENTKTMIENGSMDFEAYKKMIIGELAYEKKILKFTEMDKKSKPYELKEIIRRINQRIDVISKELTQNPDEDNGEEEEKPEQKNGPVNNQKASSQMTNKSQVKPQQQQTKITDNKAREPIDNVPSDNIGNYKDQQKQVQNQPHHQGQQPQSNKIPSQYIIQKKVLVTDPKTGKQMYVMKNVVDPKYAEMLKQKQNAQQAQVQNQHQQQHHHQPQTQQQNQHIIQQKVLVTDPKTGKQMYVMKNVVDPRYAQAQKQTQVVKNQIPQNQTGHGKEKLAPEKMGDNVKQNPQPQQSNNEEKEKYQKYINGLIKEYTEAKEYFKRNGQENLANKSRQDLRILMHAKQKIDGGRHKEVKISSLPKSITYEYIYGYSENERTEKFKLVLTQLIKNKNEIEQKMKSILEKLPKLKKKDFEKAKVTLKPKLDEFKAKKEKTAKLMEDLKVLFKNKWAPAPEYKKVQEEDQIEKISYEGCKYGLKIKVGKTDYDKDKTSLVILLEVNKTKNLKKTVQLKQDGDFNEEWMWEFTGDEWKYIPKTFLYIDLYRQHTFSNDKKGSGKIDLTSIRRGTVIKTDCKIEIESKRVEPIVNFVITPVLPEGKKYYEKTTKEVIKITKIFHPFTGKQSLTDNTSAPSKPQASPAAQKPNIKTNNVNNNAQGNTQNQPVIDKSKFKPEELEDVDFIDNLNTLKVLDFKIKELELKIKKIDGRTPREMLQKKVKMNCKKKQLENGMEEGSISPKDYMEFMRVQLEHDQLLVMYMKQTNQEEKMKTVMQRTVLIKQEMEELKKFMK